MLPLFDENPVTRPPFVTWLLILANLGIYLVANTGLVSPGPAELVADGEVVEVPADLAFSLAWAAVPCELVEQRALQRSEISDTYYRTGDPLSCRGSSSGDALFPEKHLRLALLSSMFLHSGLFHLGFNMLFLWVFGNNVEDRLGHIGFGLFYVLAGLVSTTAYVVTQPAGTVAILGASGAVAGVMGSYLIWYPDAPIRTLVFLILVDIRARWFLLAWFLLQFFTWSGPRAWIAHVSGFVVGVIAGRIIRKVQPRLRWRVGQPEPSWDDTGGAGHGPYPHLDEVWAEPHHEQYGT